MVYRISHRVEAIPYTELPAKTIAHEVFQTVRLASGALKAAGLTRVIKANAHEALALRTAEHLQAGMREGTNAAFLLKLEGYDRTVGFGSLLPGLQARKSPGKFARLPNLAQKALGLHEHLSHTGPGAVNIAHFIFPFRTLSPHDRAQIAVNALSALQTESEKRWPGNPLWTLAPPDSEMWKQYAAFGFREEAIGPIDDREGRLGWLPIRSLMVYEPDTITA